MVAHRVPVPTSPIRVLARRLRWWLEVPAVLAYYFSYVLVRNWVAVAGARMPYHHALDVIDVERVVGMYHERTIQQWFLPARWFIQFWNIYYGTIHFAMPAIMLVVLYLVAPARYPRWRNALAITNALALVTFALWPLMPPRLMPAHFGFVDTATTVGGLGKAARSAKEFGNLYAAMPSLHLAWATWAALAVWAVTRNRALRATAAVYPFVTLFAVVVTANHWIVDGVGGVAFLAAGFAVATPLTRWAGARAADAGPR